MADYLRQDVYERWLGQKVRNAMLFQQAHGQGFDREAWLRRWPATVPEWWDPLLQTPKQMKRAFRVKHGREPRDPPETRRT